MVECQLPKLDVAGSNPVSRSKINNLRTAEKHTLHSPPLSIMQPLWHLDDFGQDRFLELLYRSRPFFDARFRVDVKGHPNSVPALVRSHLRVHLGFVAEAGMRPPHDLEVNTAETDWVQLGFDVVFE